MNAKEKTITVRLTQSDRDIVVFALGYYLGGRLKDQPKPEEFKKMMNSTLRVANKFGCTYIVDDE